MAKIINLGDKLEYKKFQIDHGRYTDDLMEHEYTLKLLKKLDEQLPDTVTIEYFNWLSGAVYVVVKGKAKKVGFYISNECRLDLLEHPHVEFDSTFNYERESSMITIVAMIVNLKVNGVSNAKN